MEAEEEKKEDQDISHAFQLVRGGVRHELFSYSLFAIFCLFMIGFSVYAILLTAATGLPERQERIWLLLILLLFIPLTWFSVRRVSSALRLRRLLRDDLRGGND